LADRHLNANVRGYNGNPSPQGAPLDGGSEVLILLGIAYAAKKTSDRMRETIIDP